MLRHAGCFFWTLNALFYILSSIEFNRFSQKKKQKNMKNKNFHFDCWTGNFLCENCFFFPRLIWCACAFFSVNAQIKSATWTGKLQFRLSLSFTLEKLRWKDRKFACCIAGIFHAIKTIPKNMKTNVDVPNFIA